MSTWLFPKIALPGRIDDLSTHSFAQNGYADTFVILDMFVHQVRGERVKLHLGRGSGSLGHVNSLSRRCLDEDDHRSEQ